MIVLSVAPKVRMRFETASFVLADVIERRTFVQIRLPVEMDPAHIRNYPRVNDTQPVRL